jgi:hypothetical protein
MNEIMHGGNPLHIAPIIVVELHGVIVSSDATSPVRYFLTIRLIVASLSPTSGPVSCF